MINLHRGDETRRAVAGFDALCARSVCLIGRLRLALSVGSGGFTLHAAARAGGMDDRGREALLKYALRPPIAQERITEGPDGLVRIALKKAFSDGTVAVGLDPLSLLTRLCAAVPPPRFHTVRLRFAVVMRRAMARSASRSARHASSVRTRTRCRPTNFSRGPMGYGMGKLQVLDHDGNGRVSFEERPFVVMIDHAYVDMGTLDKERSSRHPADTS